LKNYKIKFHKNQVIAGRNCYVIDIIPKYKGKPSQRIWVDAEYNIILKTQKKSYDGDLLHLSYFQEINFSPKFEKDFFKFKTPKGAKIINYELTDKNLSIKDIEKKIGFKILLPKFLPYGYELESSTISFFQNRKSAYLRYTDGLNVISLFERKHTKYNSPINSKEINIGKIKGKIAVSQEGEILTWTIKNLDLTLIGDMKKSYLLRFAESIGE
jgi:negative regulator of sigma E activity